MESILEDIVDEAIKLEISMYKLYTVFLEIYPEDAEFWKQLANEEINHADTIRIIKPFLHLDETMSKKFLTNSPT